MAAADLRRQVTVLAPLAWSLRKDRARQLAKHAPANCFFSEEPPACACARMEPEAASLPPQHRPQRNGIASSGRPGPRQRSRKAVLQHQKAIFKVDLPTAAVDFHVTGEPVRDSTLRAHQAQYPSLGLAAMSIGCPAPTDQASTRTLALIAPAAEAIVDFLRTFCTGWNL